MKIKKFNEMCVINESAPIEELESAFMNTGHYSDAKDSITTITDALEVKFYEFCEENGFEGEGSSDADRTFSNILNELVSRY